VLNTFDCCLRAIGCLRHISYYFIFSFWYRYFIGKDHVGDLLLPY